MKYKTSSVVQMYEKNSSYTKKLYFSQINFTNNPELLNNISKLTEIQRDILFNDIIPQMVRSTKNYELDENIFDKMVVEVDFSSYVKDRSHKSKLLKSFKNINLLAPLSKNKYLVNYLYLNPFNAAQLDEYIKVMMKLQYEERTST